MADPTADRWNTPKVKSIRLRVGEHEFALEGDNVGLDESTFRLLDLWLKAITPESVQQGAIDALTTDVTKQAAKVQAAIEANSGLKK